MQASEDIWARVRRWMRSEGGAAWLIVLGTLALNAFWLRPELSITRLDLNDNVLHYTLIERMVEAVEGGENPLDHWVGEWTFGYPAPRTYQPLGHLVVALLYLGLGKSVGLMTLFIWVRYLLLLLLPLTVYGSARWMGLRPAYAAAAALLAPLVSTDGLYGIEFGSYVWRGSGLYAQAWSMHLLLLSLGLAFRAMQRGRGLTTAGFLLGLTFLSHFIYGYIGALSVVMLAFVPFMAARPLQRAFRVVWIGTVAFALAAFVILPLWNDAPFLNHSRWEADWKWNSFGGWAVLNQLLSGDLLDFGRLPVLSILALAGALVCLRRLRGRGATLPAGRAHSDTASSTYAFVLAGAALWLLLYCGRSAWGVLYMLLGAIREMHLHRLVGGAQVFLVLLAGIGLGSFWLLLMRTGLRWRHAAALGVTVALLWPAWSERAAYLAQGAEWGRQNLAAFESERQAVEAILAKTKERRGRVYPGLAAGWGKDFKVGSVPVYAFLSTHEIPAAAFLYHSMALTSEIMVRFNEWNWNHYQLFAIGSVLADEGRQLPDFLEPVDQAGRFHLLAAPGGGYFDLVSVPYAVAADKWSFYDIVDPWLQSDWVAKRQHLWLDFRAQAPSQMPRLVWNQPWPEVPAAGSMGVVERERQSGEVYQAELRVDRESYLLFKMTYHPNWQVLIDGEPRPTVMLSPGFVGVAVSPGRHRVECRYQPEGWKTPLLFGGLLVVLLIGSGERRGAASRVEERVTGRLASWPERAGPQARARWLTAAGLVALALPTIAPLLTSELPAGHDTFEYVPRLVEFHENIRHGVFLPRWAADLSSGYGQPFFIFNPPLIYYLGEFWLLLGFGAVTALNLACVMIVAGSAAAMFALGRLYFGNAGGWLAAAAYLYAPYFQVDLWVRHALAEFAAFPFYPLALYGFGRHALQGGRRFLALGAIGYAGAIYAHHPAAFLFSPLLGLFVLLQACWARSWKLLGQQAAGVLLGLGLGATIWLPSLVEREFVKLDRLLEGYLQYTNHFVYLHQFVSTGWDYGLSVAGYEDGMSFSLGWSHLLLALLVWLGASRRLTAAQRRLLRFFALTGLAYCLLMTPGALWLWDKLPLIGHIQFPWRMLAATSVCVALLVAAFGALWPDRSRWRKIAVAAAVGILVVPHLAHLGPSRYYRVDLSEWGPAQIARRGVGVTTRNEYEPRWAEQPLSFRAEAAVVVSGDGQLGVTERSPVRWSVPLEARTATVIEMSCFYYPGWVASVDGRPAPIEVAEPSGLIRLETPPGNHQIELRFTRTPLRWLADGLSLGAFLFLFWLWHSARPNRRKRATIVF